MCAKQALKSEKAVGAKPGIKKTGQKVRDVLTGLKAESVKQGKETGMMSDRTKIEILRDEIVIPQIVQQKADAAYAIIRERNKVPVRALEEQEKAADQKDTNGLHKTRKTRKVLPLVAAAVMLTAGLAVAAGSRWNEGIRERWQVEEPVRERLQEEGAVTFAMQSQTRNGITITAEQSITDNYSVYLAFRVEGYSLKEGLSPGFEEVQVAVDGVDDTNYSAGFYDRPVTGEDGGMEYADSSAAQQEEGHITGPYVREDGSMIYLISMTDSNRGWALGRDIDVVLENLCGYEEETGEPDTESTAEGIWNFSWNLQGTDHIREWTGDIPVGDSGAVIRRIELSPASGYVELDWPRQRETRQVVGPDGEMMEVGRWVRAPRMSGVKLKDGTMYQDLFSGDGTEGYVSSDQASARYYAFRGCGRIIDPEQVYSLLFENGKEGGFYEVVIE